MNDLILTALQFINDKKWWALGALVIGFVVRAAKPDVRWFPNLDARWRPLLAALLGIALGGLDKIVSGDSPVVALQFGLSAAVAAILGHIFGIEVARNGKELPMVASTPPPDEAK